ncbi:MAG: hypothetical protein EBU33_04230 [Sphingobacteriia bacterium]|nr:hypothetical protein [Sphingobacteriia bacterium]
MGVGFVGSNWSALAMTIVIGAVYLVGALEIKRFRAVTSSLASTLANIPDPLSNIGDWLGSLHPSLHIPK